VAWGSDREWSRAYREQLEARGEDAGLVFHSDPTLVVEDSERGLRAAVAAGIDCVVVANAFVRGQDLSKASYFVDSVADLPELLRGV
jgi:beta-phosphoglucomutase-like phosphatase (HAD superfamily)